MEVRTKSAEEIIQKKLDDLSRKNRYQEIISVVTQNVHQSIDLQTVLDNSIEAMRKNIDKMDNVSIYLVEGDEAVIKAHYGYTRDYLKRASRIPYPKGGVWRTIIDAKPRYVPDTENDTAIGQAGRDMGIKCYLVVPLFNYEKVVGTITIVSYEKNVFDEEERKLMDIVSKQISIAIRNAKQAQELKDSEELLRHNVEILSKKNKYEEIINTVARSVHSSIDLDEVLENAVDAMHENIDCAETVGIFFVEGDYAVNKANRGYSKELFNKVKKIPRPKGFTWKTILEGKLIYCNDTEADSIMGPAGKKAGTKSYASMPIKLKGKTIACININSFQKDAFDNEDLNLLDIVAQQIGVAINNATQAEALKKSEETLRKNLKQLSKKQRYEEIISTVTRNVHRSIDLKEVLENAADALGKNVDHADHVAIYLVEGDTAVLKSYTGYPKWFTAKVARIPKPVGATWKTLIDGIPRFVPDISKDKHIGPAGRKVGTKSYASMPIKHNDTTIGCINISSRTPNALDEEEIKLLEIVATQIETAINNANQAEALKRSREELRESREHFRLLVETTNVIPWEYDPKTDRFTYVGPQAEKLLGYPAPIWYEENFWSMHIHEEDREEVVKTCKEATSALIDHELEYRMISKDGKVVWIYEMVTVISEKGKAKTLRGFMIDVTERKTAEYEKQEAQERYRTLIEHSHDIIVETNINGTFLYINPTFNEVLGYQEGELLGRSVFEHIHEDDTPAAIAQFSTTINEFKKGTATYRFKNKSGEWRWLESVGSPFRTATGEVRTVISSRDITERMESENKLQNAFSEIELLKDKLQKENVYLKKEIELTYGHADIIGQSKAIKAALNKIEQVAQTDATVLLAGETGTGKELFANMTHNLSSRKDRAMIKVNCAALPPHLIESELFGHEKGSFTGAVSKTIGRFEVADDSTIFLDEVGELPLELQSKLLRVLQEGEFQRVGSSKTIKVNVRVIAASNNELLEAVHNGMFREDLYYRLNVFPIDIPPLRERKEDIPDLLWFFISEFEEKMGKTIKNISRKDMENLINYPWPGNVRQLRNVIERAMIISSGPDLEIELPGIRSETPPQEIKPITEVERDHISYILNMTNWRIRGKSGAAEILGLKPTTLESRLKKLGIKRTH
ncbi:MAG: sigma 54-interacting transcriptional regulator [Candidatus Dadabacteria bacterium]|nr:sigma 54-interacting transcriptional regulator [Candidatus Dadabacteria bacterium]